MASAFSSIDTVSRYAIHERCRLAIVSTLAATGPLSFSDLKAMLPPMSDGNLSAHSRTLDATGYITIHKAFQGKRTHTTFTLTNAGYAALSAYLNDVSAMVRQIRKLQKKGEQK